MKNILAVISVFSAVFIISLFLMFPYSAIIGYAFDKASSKAGITAGYTALDAGPFSADFENLEINSAPVGDMKVSYSPLSVFTKKATILIQGPVNSQIELSPEKTVYAAEINSALINSFAKGAAVFNTPFKFAGTANPAENKAEFTAVAESIEIDSPIGKLPFENITAQISVNGSSITVKKLTSKDSMNLNMKGIIRINPADIQSSVVNIKGSADVFGEKKEVMLMGRLDSIQPSIR